MFTLDIMRFVFFSYHSQTGEKTSGLKKRGNMSGGEHMPVIWLHRITVDAT